MKQRSLRATLATLALAAGLVASVLPAHADEAINTVPAWNGVDEICPFGEPNSATYGQTFTVPSGSAHYLGSFTFYLQTYFGSTPFKFYVIRYDQATERTVGSVLFESELLTSPATPGQMTQYTIDTGNLNLEPGAQYLGFISCSNYFDGAGDWACMGFIWSGDPHPGGNFVHQNNGSDFNNLFTASWEHWFGGLDAAFTANFTVAYGVEALFDTTRPVKAGATIPIKLRIVDASGANVSSADLVVQATGIIRVTALADGPLQDAGNANPDDNFRYDATLGGYIYNYKTAPGMAGKYEMTFTVDGESSPDYKVPFEVR